jgi:hypothetical protein
MTRFNTRHGGRLAQNFALLVLAGFLGFGAAASSEAATTYFYVGNDYDNSTCGGSYCTGGPYSLDFTFTTTLTGSALDNLSFQDYLGDHYSVQGERRLRLGRRSEYAGRIRGNRDRDKCVRPDYSMVCWGVRQLVQYAAADKLE